MAKGLRSSRIKSNNTKLRKKTFGPVEDARTERLSAKLLELAQQPKPERDEMDVETEETKKKNADDVEGEAMDIDGEKKTTTGSSSSKKKGGRVEKRISKYKKPRNTIAFKSRHKPGDKLAKSGRRRL
ncbi:hypothetical protein EJ05DRAFT_539888 [Pseudovirgaria hyperparasitica]|uniref:DUF2423 domain-containing protein n=1 Tax=Pseudovirgaria hyperparasitica TaxID=470096 RepID=A0A6A6W2A3_9PEZI|nr:uncharacterized protein EJ05DRAFT_539888 [Pseudovirgaria hyperparasitica]KAF2756080.1 hypothetical protein EJ05DRAFT_539888 [Pseudovirgaria hyperparasitica]